MESVHDGGLVQALGIGYSFQPSLAMRKQLTKDALGVHSAQTGSFTYFFKGDRNTIVGDGERLALRALVRDDLDDHWPEPELGILLGRGHRITHCTLVNDFTAFLVETQGRTGTVDGTFEGKTWPRSCAVGPAWCPIKDLAALLDLEIALAITRNGSVVYDGSYAMSRIRYELASLPDRIIEYHGTFGVDVPPSKRIRLDPSGRLPAGTLISCGSGLIVPRRAYARPGDEYRITCDPIGSLRNTVSSRRSSRYQPQIADGQSGGS